MKIINIRKMNYEDARTEFLRQVEKFFVSGETVVEVLHGVGMYKLKEMVHKEVENCDYLEIFSTALHENPGTTRLRILSPDKHILDKYIVR